MALCQDSELFLGEDILKSCELNIPLTYQKKDMKICKVVGEQNKDVLLVFLRYNPETKLASFVKYYMVVDGKFIFFEKPEFHDPNATEKQAMFLNYKSDTDRFYIADKFLEILEQNPDLKTTIKEDSE